MPDSPAPKEQVKVNNVEPMNTPTSPSKRKKKKQPQQHCMRIPFFITNLSSTFRVVLPKDHIVAFITPENPETNYIEIAKVQSVEEQCRNWKHPAKMLPKAPESDFLVSPGDVKEVRCVLPENDISNETLESFHQLLSKHQATISTSSEDINHTELITMDIYMGLSGPVSQRPYTLPLKHHDWVKKEIEQLECAGVIKKSLSPWASPIITVPKKSGPGEPPKRRMCVDYHRINALQTKADCSFTGCMSLYPLLKIDEMFAKLCSSKIFSMLDLCSDYYQLASPMYQSLRQHSSLLMVNGNSTWSSLV